MKNLKLQNVETIDGFNNITGLYKIIGKIENNYAIVVECIDTKQLFVISNSYLYK